LGGVVRAIRGRLRTVCNRSAARWWPRWSGLRILVDVSHVHETTFWDVQRLATKPFIATHSCAAALCPIARNLSDDQIRAIADSGGVIGVNFFPAFLDPTYHAHPRGLPRSSIRRDGRGRTPHEDPRLRLRRAASHGDESTRALRPGAGDRGHARRSQSHMNGA
jgi:membrane dipeptidase